MFDEDRGWIVCEIQNRLNDLGDGDDLPGRQPHQLHYAGDGQWSYEEDAYNPEAMAEVVQAWLAHRKALEASRARPAPRRDAGAGHRRAHRLRRDARRPTRQPRERRGIGDRRR